MDSRIFRAGQDSWPALTIHLVRRTVCLLEGSKANQLSALITGMRMKPGCKSRPVAQLCLARLRRTSEKIEDPGYIDYNYEPCFCINSPSLVRAWP